MNFFYARHSPTPPLALPVYPAGAPLPTPAHLDRLHSAGNRAGRARCKADHARHGTHARTLGTLHRPALNTRPPTRADRNGAGRWIAWSVSGKVYNFGRLFLSIFIWIYFAKSIDNPYIYGYNIISPDKYGLQPH